MNLINQIEFNKKSVPLFGNEVDPNFAVFTILIGKNGTGKSRILREISDIYSGMLPDKHMTPTTVRRPSKFSKIKQADSLYSVIGISMSSFDKFRLEDEFPLPINYHYLGVRGISNENLSVSYLSRIISNLLSTLKESPDRINVITKTLDYLGYKPFLMCEFRFSKSMNEFYAMCAEFKPKDLESKQRIYRWLIRNCGNGADLYKSFLSEIKEIERDVKLLREHFHGFPISVTINDSELVSSSIFGYSKTDYGRLIKYGILTLKEVKVKRIKSTSHMRIINASSGEQSILVSFLAISTYITNGSVICIDEPENCLHPEWQEKYILNLNSAFGNTSDCHFIIATHSPQIVSSLPDTNCFVVDVSSQEIFTSKSLRQRSADYQLAETFKYPGFKNEYLLREFLTAIAEISSAKGISAERKIRIRKLLLLKPLIDSKDPTIELISLIEKALGKAK